MGIKKHKLNNSESSDYLNLGIATSDSEFQVSIAINKLLHIKLSLSKSIAKETKAGNITYPCFKYSDDEELQLFLIKNKNQGILLFTNQLAFDYIISISGENKTTAFQMLKSQLKGLANISVVSEIETKKLSGLKEVCS